MFHIFIFQESEKNTEVKTPGMDNVFAVEEILKKRKNKSKIEYFVKWKDYSSKFNTWEERKNILDPMLIQEFQEKIKKTKKSKHVQMKTKNGNFDKDVGNLDENTLPEKQRLSLNSKKNDQTNIDGLDTHLNNNDDTMQVSETNRLSEHIEVNIETILNYKSEFHQIYNHACLMMSTVCMARLMFSFHSYQTKIIY